MTFLLGLTGSIGMGKSTTAQMFADEGCALWDSDAIVHELYAPGGAAVGPMAKLFPSSIVDGAVSRPVLKTIIAKDEGALKQIEAIVHPLVTQAREEFVAQSKADITVLDVPLLFETGCDRCVDAVVVVTADPQEQKRRLLARGTMTPKQLETIMQMQAPDAEKRKRADYVILTDTLEHARRQVQCVVKQIRAGLADARNRS